MSKNRKQAKSKQVPDTHKKAKFQNSPSKSHYETPVWSVVKFDREGKWGESSLSDVNFWNEIFSQLKSYEGLTWNEIKTNKKKNHAVPISSLTKEARDRLAELKLDDLDNLFRFRFTGKQRLWGTIDGRVFQILWWDAEHEICPSTKRNT